jgi:2-dehydropantoate 2-reductase
MVSDTIDENTVILPVQNGIPWWYFHKINNEYQDYQIEAVDPHGILSRTIDSNKVVGCVPFVAATVTKPGIVKHVHGEWFPVGEISNEQTARVKQIAELFNIAGLRSRVLDDIRSELWLKEIGNLAFNPISVLTGATLGELCRDPGTRATAQRMMEEAKPVAEELGVSFRRTIQERIDGAGRVGEHKTSMYQDYEAKRKLEIEALIGAVVELAEMTGKQVPLIESIYNLLKYIEDNNM